MKFTYFFILAIVLCLWQGAFAAEPCVKSATALKVSSITNNTVQLNWSTADSVLVRLLNSSGTLISSGKTTSKYMNVESLTKGTTYKWELIPLCPEGQNTAISGPEFTTEPWDHVITTGSGKKYTFEDLISLSPGAIAKNGSEYLVNQNIFITYKDTLMVDQNIVVKFAPSKGIIIDSFAHFYINAPNMALFIARDTTKKDSIYGDIKATQDAYLSFKNAKFMYGMGLRNSNANLFKIDSCHFERNGKNTSGSDYAINLYAGYSVITNSKFILNSGSAIGSGANVGNTVIFKYNYLFGNTTTNGNRPQINLGPSQDGEITQIIKNTILGNGNKKVGGASVSSLLGVPTQVMFDSNYVENCRYGYTSTGNAITGSISWNTLINNNIEGLPNVGGSGINITNSTGGSEFKLSGNVIKGNLWGITVIGSIPNKKGPKVNIGNVSVAPTHAEYNIGKNIFESNGNGGKLYDLFNNSSFDMYAQNCQWGVSEQTFDSIAKVISDKADDITLGLVNYMPAYMGNDCIVPISPKVSNISHNGVRFEWTSADTSFVLKLYNPDGSLLTTFNTKSKYQWIYGTETTFSLLPLTTYTWIIQTLCPNGGVSDIVEGPSFTTEMNPYATPGTGKKYTFENLVSISNGVVTKANGIYFVNQHLFISKADTLDVPEVITVKVAMEKEIGVDSAGLFRINAAALFTCTDTTKYWAGVKANVNSFIDWKKGVFKFGYNIKMLGAQMFKVEECTFEKMANDAISSNRGYLIIKNCKFISNVGSGISSAANIGNTFEIVNCYFYDNVTANSNKPQINIAPSRAGEKSIIKGNRVIGTNRTMSGGIAASSLMSMPSEYEIDSNYVEGNRYGIAITGAFIKGSITHNILKNNKLQNNPILGGSGINITAPNGEVEFVVTANHISDHLWGITLVGNTSNFSVGPKANIGNTSVLITDPNYNPGLNVFSNNGNGGSSYDLFNNNKHNIMAQGNIWGVEAQDSILIAKLISDKSDDSKYGTVTFMPSACNAPTNVNVTRYDITSAPSEKDVNVEWDAPIAINPLFNSSIEGYNVYRDTLKLNSSLITERKYLDQTISQTGDYTYFVDVVWENVCKSAASPSKTIKVIVGIEKESQAKISIYPNPSQGTLNIEGKYSSMKLYNVIGSCVYSNQGGESQIALDNIPNGVYMIEIVTANNKIITQRFILQK